MGSVRVVACAMVVALASAAAAAGVAVGPRDDGPRPALPAVKDRVLLGFRGPLPADAKDRVEALGGVVRMVVEPIALVVADPRGDPTFPARAQASLGLRYAAYDGTFTAQHHPRNPLVPNPPTDPYWAEQWGPALVGSGAAWGQEQGDTGVLVAVLDSGVFAAHPDLGVACAPGCGASPQDSYGHGTHVAGVIAAQANSGLGIAGLAPNARLLSVKVLGDTGVGLWSMLAAGIVAAAEAGAGVISMSLGGFCPTGSDACQPVEDALDLAHGYDAVLVAAAGNYGCLGCVMYPAQDPRVVAVGATNQSDGRAEFSARGPELDLVAPGVRVYSTMSPGSYLQARVCFILGEPDALYCSLDGTSMATPHVSGLAALVRSHCPALTNDEVVAAMEAAAEDLGPVGWDPNHGAGRIDAGRTLATACAG